MDRVGVIKLRRREREFKVLTEVKLSRKATMLNGLYNIVALLHHLLFTSGENLL
jgi:hypothetical protein